MSKVIGYTAGVYDLFHIGHLNVLKKAKKECDYLIVALTTDELCVKNKGKTPIVPYIERYEILLSNKYVDEVIPQNELNKVEDWKKHKFHKIFAGSDKKLTKEYKDFTDFFNKEKVEIVYFDYTEHTSSTFLRSVLEKI